MSVLSIYFNTRIQKTTSYGALRSARYPGILGEAKCKGNGMGRYEGSWPDKVTHLTQWPDLNLRVVYQRNPRKRSETVNLKAAGYRRTDGKNVLQVKEGDDLCAGRRAAAHFKGGSDVLSQQFAKFYTQG